MKYAAGKEVTMENPVDGGSGISNQIRSLWESLYTKKEQIDDDDDLSDFGFDL